MSNKTLKKAIKRVNKTKEELNNDMKAIEKVKQLKEMVRKLYPFVENLDSVYDAQTTVNALSGFIASHIENKVAEIKLKELPIDLSTEEDSKIKTAILSIVDLFQDEGAQELSETLERLGSTLQQYIVHKHMSAPMDLIKIDDILSK